MESSYINWLKVPSPDDISSIIEFRLFDVFVKFPIITSTSLNEFDKEEKFDEKLSTFDTISFILISLLLIIEFKFKF